MVDRTQIRINPFDFSNILYRCKLAYFSLLTNFDSLFKKKQEKIRKQCKIFDNLSLMDKTQFYERRSLKPLWFQNEPNIYFPLCLDPSFEVGNTGLGRDILGLAFFQQQQLV